MFDKGVIEFIAIMHNVVSYNDHHERGYLNLVGVYVIKIRGKEFYHLLDIKSGADLTKSDYLRVQTTTETSIEYIWRHNLYGGEEIDLSCFEKYNLFTTVCREHEKELFRKITKKEMMNKQEDAISASNE